MATPTENVRSIVNNPWFVASTVFVIPATIALITWMFNSSQLQISRLKEITEILKSMEKEKADEPEKKFTYVRLGLQGEEAIPAALEMLNSYDDSIQLLGSKTLSIIGKSAEKPVSEAFKSTKNSDRVRGGALYTMGLMKLDGFEKLAIETFNEKSSSASIRQSANAGLAYIRTPTAKKFHLEILKNPEYDGSQIQQDSTWAISQYEERESLAILMRMLVSSNSGIRLNAAKGISKIAGSDINKILLLQAAKETDKDVKNEFVLLIQEQKKLH
jgi:hypothetical protein